VSTAIAASTLSSASGRSSALATIAGAAAGGRWAIMTRDGSIATSLRSSGSYAPAPAPMFTTVTASPSAAWIAAAIRGSGRRVVV
jgi:hypothetical protein